MTPQDGERPKPGLEVRFPTTVGIPYGDGREVRLHRGDDGSFTATLVLVAYGWHTDTDRTAHRDPAGVVTGDPELVVAFPALLAKRDGLLDLFIAAHEGIRWIQDRTPEIIAQTKGLADAVRELAESLARRAREAEDAGRLEEHRALKQERKRLIEDYKDLYGLEG